MKRHRKVDRLLDAEMFKVLGEPTRVRLLTCLLKCGRRCSVTEIAECCSIDFSVVARHLATLAAADLVSSEKVGRTVWYWTDGDALSGRFTQIAVSIREADGASGCDETCGPGSACC